MKWIFRHVEEIGLCMYAYVDAKGEKKEREKSFLEVL